VIDLTSRSQAPRVLNKTACVNFPRDMFVRSWVWAWRFHEDWLNFPRPTVRKIQRMAYIEHGVTNPRLGDLGTGDHEHAANQGFPGSSKGSITLPHWMDARRTSGVC
jgi:hypothetical protein